MNPAVIIPARMGSTRFPGKPLQIIGERTLIEHTWLAAKQMGWPVWIATDDVEIEAIAHEFGADVVMTGECANGTERCAEAMNKLDLDNDLIINWQGDSPLCPPEFAYALIDELKKIPEADVATPVQPCDRSMLRRLRAEQTAGVTGATTAAISSGGRALYFSKAIIPHNGPWFFHVGMYAYRSEALFRYGRTPPCMIEESEGLEQLRFIDQGWHIRAVQVDPSPIWEVNNPHDVTVVANLIRCRDEIDRPPSRL